MEASFLPLRLFALAGVLLSFLHVSEAAAAAAAAAAGPGYPTVWNGVAYS